MLYSYLRGLHFFFYFGLIAIIVVLGVILGVFELLLGVF